MEILELKNNILTTQEKIKKYALDAKRSPQEIELVAVSKYHSAKLIEAAYGCGLRHFGENYIQEWQQKSVLLSHLKELKWHLIGPVQSNKAKYLNDSVFCLQSLSSLSLAKEIEKKSPRDTRLNVCVQLQIDPCDKNKSGMTFVDATKLCEYINKSSKMKLQGFMGIGPAGVSAQELKTLYQKFASECDNLWADFTSDTSLNKIISLGMSGDMDTAIQCGSTMVRVGTAIFGARQGKS